MPDIIAFENVDAGYGRTRILDNLSFRVSEGEVFGVIGPNGCGKSTMLNALSGFIHPTEGRISFLGEDISSYPPYAVCRLGIGRTWQIPRPFEGMTLHDNVLAAALHGGRADTASGSRCADNALEETGLKDKSDILSGELSLLDRKKLELARAMAVSPKLLLLDEVAAGLTEAETAEITELVSKLKGDGYTTIWIEHNIETMLNATDRLMCMAEGKNVICGDPKEVMASDIVEELYLGKEPS